MGMIPEWVFNRPIGALVVADLKRAGHEAVLIDKYDGTGYSAAMSWLAGKIAGLQCDAAVELHFNSSDKASAEGHEWLHWGASVKGKALALHLERAYSATFPGAKRRGLLARGSSDRGAEFLRGTHCPAVICEPFFGSNANEWREAKRCEPMLAAAIAKGLIAWAKEVQP